MPVVSTTRAAATCRPSPSTTPHDPAVMIEPQILDRTLGDVEVRGFGQQFADRPAIELAVGLGARAAHRRPLAAVEHAELDAGAVDRPAHEAVERVDLAHQMPLAEPADRRVARHLADRLALMGEQQRARPDPRRRRRRLAPGMPAADHDDIVISRTIAHGDVMYRRAGRLSSACPWKQPPELNCATIKSPATVTACTSAPIINYDAMGMVR